MKQKAASSKRLAILLLSVFLAALLMLEAWFNNRPISGPYGEAFTITLQSIHEGVSMHRINAGLEHSFRIWRGEEADLLLQPDMQGRSFRVLAEKRYPSKSAAYYRIIEMVTEDGTFAYTWEDYAAGQAERLPGRMLILALLLAGMFVLICWSTNCFFSFH